jgi:hypothetical protein
MLPGTWAEEVVDAAGRPLLMTGEFRDVLGDGGQGRWDLRRRMWDDAPALLLAVPGAYDLVHVVDPAATWNAVRSRVRAVGFRRAARAPGAVPVWARAVPLVLLVALAVFALAIAGGAFGWGGVVALLGVAALCGALLLFARYAEYGFGAVPGETRELLAREVVAPYLRERVSELVNTPERERVLPVTDAPGLGGISDRDQVVRTRAAQRLGRVAGDMNAGSVAVCGRRGVGKTTLLRSLCDNRLARPDEPELRVLVSAPVDYDVREFVLHLFARLCVAVGGDPGDAVRGEFAIVPRRGARAVAWIAALAATLAGLALLTGLLPYAPGTLAWAAHRAADPAVRAALRVPAGIALLLVAALAVRAARRDRPPRGTGSIQDEARRHLERIRFLQTYSTGYSGGVKLPAGVEVGRTTGRQLVEQQITLPDLVDLYRGFAERTALWWRARHGRRGRLVVGIDEIDRIRDAADAERFLNDIKAVFGSPHCVYLVSVSEEAMARFQVRAPGRTAFDSAFDEFVGVAPLSFAEARDLLRRRVAGISDPFVALCHVLSGGLPRDVVRTARALVAGAGAPRTLTEAAARLIAQEVADLKDAALRRPPDDAPGRDLLLRRLVDDAWPRTDPAALAAAAADVRDGAAGLAAALDVLAQVAYLFGPGLDHLVADLRAPADPGGIADALARARSAPSTDPGLAAELLARVRRRYGLPDPAVA